MQAFWDERFASEIYLYGENPNPQFKDFIDGTPSGKILLPGEGEGRNAVYAAKNNWTVTAIDQSEVGKNKALQLAEKSKVQIEYVIDDILKYPFQNNHFDAIAMVFLHLPKEIREQIHHHLISKLKKGGKFFIVGFSQEQLQFNSGGPKDVEMLYSKEMLQNDFKDLQIKSNNQFIANLNEGEGHMGEASLVVFEAIKK